MSDNTPSNGMEAGAVGSGFIERRSNPVSIEQIPGFAIFREWLGAEFGGLRKDIGYVQSELTGMAEKVAKLSECVSEGNGQPSLKQQVADNTRFRQEYEETVKDAKRARRTAMFAFFGSIAILGLNVALHAIGIL